MGFPGTPPTLTSSGIWSQLLRSRFSGTPPPSSSRGHRTAAAGNWGRPPSQPYRHLFSQHALGPPLPPAPPPLHRPLTLLRHWLRPCLGGVLADLTWVSSANLTLAQFHPAAPVRLSQVPPGQPLQSIPGSPLPLEGMGEEEKEGRRRRKRRVSSLLEKQCSNSCLPPPVLPWPSPSSLH